MMLPNRHRAHIDRAKITDYLLSPSHLEGSAKAAFFTRFGFRLEQWRTLAGALLAVGVSNPVSGLITSSHGVRYTVDGDLRSPDGRNPRIRTVWVVEPGRFSPRLVTAYPLEDVTMTAIREHDRVVLTEDLPAEHLFMGDVGTVVHVYAKAAAYEVEFVSPEGRTIAVVTLDQSKVRQAGRGDASRAGHVA